jgi:hypothetical protein
MTIALENSEEDGGDELPPSRQSSVLPAVSVSIECAEALVKVLTFF